VDDHESLSFPIPHQICSLRCLNLSAHLIPRSCCNVVQRCTDMLPHSSSTLTCWLSLPAHEYIPSVQQCKLPQFMHPLTLQLLLSGSVGGGPASLLSSYRWGVGRWAGPLTLPLGATSCTSHASPPATFPYACLWSVKYVCALVTEHTLPCPTCILHMMVEPRHCGTSHCSPFCLYRSVLLW